MTEFGVDAASPGIARLILDERVAMVRLATLLVGSRAIAEEIVQEACIAVDRRWDQLDNPGGYLRATVVNGCRMALRRQVVEDRYLATIDRSSPTVELPDHLIEVRDALGRLGERQRVLIVLRYFADLPDDEIAVLLNCRRSTVRSLARRALQTLRRELA